MSSRCDFLLKFFSDRFILLKDEWLNSVIDFLESQSPQVRSFSDEQFAHLVFEQWTFSNFKSTSFPVFGNLGINAEAKKQNLQGTIVCQVNSVIDVGSPFYAQYCSLTGTVKQDNTGFEKLFHEKEEDFNTKSCRLLKLTLSDGESSLKAIEFWKCPQLSLYCQPGSKIVIRPPCTIRKGTFFLKPNNCQILGGEVLPLLNSELPAECYARFLGLKVSKPKPSIVPNSNTNTRPPPIRPPQPSPNVSKYFKKPEVAITSNREVSPDILADEEADSNENASVHVSMLLSRKNGDYEEFETRKTPKSPRKRLSAGTSSTRISGSLTSRKTDPMDEILENMIEDGEEPVDCAPKRKSSISFRTEASPPLKKVKVEPTSDDDDEIQIIELEEGSEKAEKKEKLSPEEKAALTAFSLLKLSSLSENLKKIKYSIGSRRFSLLAIIDDVVEPLRVVDDLWTMKVRLKDDSGVNEALIDNSTLQNLIGYTCEEAMAVRKSSDLEKRRDGKRRLEALEHQLQRLDLVFEIEFFAGSSASCPVIRSMSTLAEKIDVY